MPIDGQLKLILQKYRNIDSAHHSVNAHFGRLAKRSRWENMRALCVHLLSFGLIAQNSSLDKATLTLIGCTEEQLRKSILPEEQKEVLRILTVHRQIVERNGGSKKEELCDLIVKVKSLALFSRAKSEVPKAEIKIESKKTAIDLLDACRKGRFAQITVLPDVNVDTLKKLEADLWADTNWSYEEIKAIPASLLRTAASLPAGSRSHFQALACLSEHFFSSSMLLQKIDDPAFWILFERGTRRFQAKVIDALLEGCPARHLARLNGVGMEAWHQAGAISRMHCQPQRIDSLARDLQPQALMAYLNGIATSPGRSDWAKEEYVSGILTRLLLSENIAHLSQLSNNALKYFKIPFDDSLWRRLLRSLNAPQSDQQKRLLHHLCKELLKAPFHAPSVLAALTKEQARTLSWQEYPRGQQLILAIRSQQWREHVALLRNLARSLSAAELAEVQAAMSDSEDKQVLQAVLCEPSRSAQPELVEKLHAADDNSEASMIVSVLEALLAGDKSMEDRLEKLNSASTEAWQKAGERLRHQHDCSKCDVAILTEKVCPEALMAFLDGAAVPPNAKPALISHILAFHIASRKDIPFALLSDDALACFDCAGIVLERVPLWHRLLSDQGLEKRLLLHLAKQIFHSGDIDRQADFLKTLSANQMRQMPLEDFPRHLQPFFAWKLHNRELNASVANFSKDELHSCLEIVQKANFSRLELALFVDLLWLPVEDQPALIALLTRQLFYHAQAREILDFPRNLLHKNFGRIHDPYIQNQLLRSLDPVSLRLAIEVWDPMMSLWSLSDYEFPVEKVMDALENPAKIKALAEASAGIFARDLIPSSNPKSWILREMLEGLEKHPWKIWLVLDRIDIHALSQWEGGDEDPRIKWPHCFQAIDWYKNKVDETRSHLHALTTFVSHNNWKEAWELVQSFEENTRNYLFASIRMREIPQLSALSKPLFIAALFDDKARRNMRKAIQKGLAADGSFVPWVDLIETLQNDQSLPDEARKKIASLPKKVRLSVSIGGIGCPLNDQYGNPKHADVQLQMGSSSLPAHSILLRLDPFFRPYLVNNTIPTDKITEASLRLKWLYNQLSFRELIQPDAQLMLQKTSALRLSLAPLFQQPGTNPDIILHGCEDEPGIPAHRFILASALPFFAGLFRHGMRDSAIQNLRLENLTHSQVAAVLRFVYTGTKPNCVDQASQIAYNRALRYLRAGS